MPSNRAADEFTRLISIMATLRAPDGCPWDREQTIDTLKPFVLEETYEMLEAIDRHDHAALCEELGDFLFQAVFLAQLEGEAGHFTIADSLKSIADKLVRRHPHVFKRDEGEASLDSANQVRVRWEEIKQQERTAKGDDAKKPKTLLSGIAPALPALLRAYHIGVRAASVNFDWTKTADVVDKIQEEVDELRAEVANGRPVDHARAEEEMGDCSSRSPSSRASSTSTGDRPAQGERQVHEALHNGGARRRRVRPRDEGHDARRARTGMATR